MKTNDFIQTYSGGKFYPFDVNQKDIKLDDIAHSLSLLCRFIGHCETFYSVGQHSVLVSKYCKDEYKLQGLLHDAAESYISDIAHPIKANDLYTNIRKIEDDILNEIYSKFGVNVTEESTEHIKYIDKCMLYTEKRDLLKPGITWEIECNHLYKPFPEKIESWTSEKSELEFYKTFSELYF